MVLRRQDSVPRFSALAIGFRLPRPLDSSVLGRWRSTCLLNLSYIIYDIHYKVKCQIDAPLHLVSMRYNDARQNVAAWSLELGAWSLELGAWSLRLLSIGHIDARQFVARPGEFFISSLYSFHNLQLRILRRCFYRLLLQLLLLLIDRKIYSKLFF